MNQQALREDVEHLLVNACYGCHEGHHNSIIYTTRTGSRNKCSRKVKGLMKHILLEAYKKHLVEFRESAPAILSQLEREFSKPDQKAPLNSKRLLVASGFYNEETTDRQEKENSVPYLKQHTEFYQREGVFYD